MCFYLFIFFLFIVIYKTSYNNLWQFIVVGNGATQGTFLKARFVIFWCQKYVKEGYIEMATKIYLETSKTCPGSLHFPLLKSYFTWFCKLGSIYFVTDCKWDVARKGYWSPFERQPPTHFCFPHYYMFILQ